MESLTSYWRSLASSLAKAEANWGPLLDIMESCRPNRLKTWEKKSLATPAASMVLEHGIMITPFVRLWSTTTIIESLSCTLGRSVTRSMESCLKGRDEDEEIGASGGRVGWVFTLFCWQVAHPSMNQLTYVESPGHQKSCSRKVLVQNLPAWPRVEEEWREETRAWRASGGIYILPL